MEHNEIDLQRDSVTGRSWLASMILRDPGRWSSRLGALVSWMKMIGRGGRRRFGRAAAGVLAGASGIALMAMLAGPMVLPVAAAAITVDGVNCTLSEAIRTANTGSIEAGCTTGDPSGPDTITLAADITLTLSYGPSSGGDTGLPTVVTPITINGGGFTIARSSDGGTPQFRLFDVGSGGNLTLSNVTLSNGYAYEAADQGKGGAVYVMSGGSLTLDGANISGNKSNGAGGGIYAKASTVTVTNSTISTNSANDGGGISTITATLTITGSFINDNLAVKGSVVSLSYGGGLMAQSSDVTLTNSEVNGNEMLDNQGYGGGMALHGTTITVTGSSIDGNDNTFVSFTLGGGVWMKESYATFETSTVSENVNSSRGGGIYGLLSTLIMNSSVISGNQTLEDNGAGAGMRMYNSAVTVTNSEIRNNSGTGGNVWGGGMLIGADGGRDAEPREMLLIDNSIISGNYSDSGGGGIYAFYLYQATITNSTIIDNDGGINGGGIYMSYVDDGLIANTLVLSNTADNGYGGGVLITYSTAQIVDSLIAGNYSYNDGGGVNVYYESTVVISGTTISNNSTNANGGGVSVYYYNNTVTIENSTFSGNDANYNGGGIHTTSTLYDDDPVTILHSTVTGNTAGDYGGGIYLASGAMTIDASIVSGNSATSGYEIYQSGGTLATNYNVLGHSGSSEADAFYGFTPGATDFDATSDSADATALGDIIETTLADNGGKGTLPGGLNTRTHLLVDGSPALNIISGAVCDVDTDQRGEERPGGDGCDAGAVESPYSAGGGDTSIFISTWTAGNAGSLGYGPHDVLQWDGDGWTRWFTGTAAGLDPLGKWKHNLNAIWISGTEDAELIFSLTQDNRVVPGIRGVVDGMDLLRWDGDALSLWFDGQDVGLNVKTQEKIDGLHILQEVPEWSEFAGDDCDAYLLISTQGNGLVPKPGNVKPKNAMKFGGEDVVGFCATNLGATTTGYWEMVLDGSAYKVLKNNIESLAANEDASVLYLTSQKQFRVHEAFGGHSMVFAFDMETERFSGPYVRVMDDLGIQPKVDALHVSGELSLP